MEVATEEEGAKEMKFMMKVQNENTYLMGGSNWNDMYNENRKNEIKSAIYFAAQEKFVMEAGNF